MQAAGGVRLNTGHSLRSFALLSDATRKQTALPRRSEPRVRSPSEWQLNHGLISLETHATTQLEPETTRVEEGKKFNWFKHWWPVQFVYNLESDRPNRVELMGEFFAVWKGANGEWVAMRDMCPHRLAPLSEGRVEEDGTLMCSYHGWRFNDCGKCVKIPQADDEKAHDAARNNPRSAAKTFPCQVSATILWIWPDASESAFAEAGSTSLPIPDAFVDYYGKKKLSKDYRANFCGDLPYDYEILMEQLIDPSHVFFAHHGIGPLMKRSNAGPLHMKLIDSESFNSNTSTYKNVSQRDISLSVLGQCSCCYEIDISKSGVSNPFIAFLAVPVRPGRARLLSLSLDSGALTGNEKPALVLTVLRRWFPWVLHLQTMAILSGDNVFLQMQDKNLRDVDGWNQKSYFTPTSADALLIRIKQWMHAEGGGGPFAAERKRKAMQMLTRRQLLDRYDQHVSQCKACQKGLRFINRLSMACKILSRSALLIGCAMLLNVFNQGSIRIWPAAATALVCAVFSFLERFLNEKIIPLFFYVDYIHAEKN